MICSIANLNIGQEDISLAAKTPEDNMPWFYIWLISSVVIYLFELYLDQRQLRNFYTTARPKSIEQYLDAKEFKKC